MDYQFNTHDLPATAEAANLTRVDRHQYTPFEEFLYCLARLPKTPRKVHNYALSIHGRAVNDSLQKYIANQGENASLLKECLKSPRHYLVAKNEQIRPYPTPSFELSRFCHQAMLQPENFDRVVMRPKHNRATIEGNVQLIKFFWGVLGTPQDTDLTQLSCQELREKVAELEALASLRGYTFIPAESFDQIRIIRASYNAYGGGVLPRIMPYIKPQTSLYGIDPVTRMRVKIRPDGLLLEENWGMNAILSVKTTSALSVEAFMQDCVRQGSALKEGMALKVASEVTGRKFTAAVMIMVQTVTPYQVAILYWDAADLEAGKRHYAQALRRVGRCREENQWLGFDALAEAQRHGIIPCKLPCDYGRVD